MTGSTGTALLVMDVQLGITQRFAEGTDYLPRLAGTIDVARAHGIPVVYVVIGFREGHPDVSRSNKSFAVMAGSGRFIPGDPGAQVHPDVAPHDGDVIVTKRRVSAFAGSDLDLVLRSMEIRHLVLAGIATSGVVLSTLRQAADLDFGLTVISDGCLDLDDEVHRVLTQKVFPRQAQVVTGREWRDQLA
ncbi:cysteine hydrolase family protein [Leekyejoonella antrihumi]|uniref:Cysteine hydrolase n=1 Tax=Leekyejoonella antrihumi TaxID=1660198 RepID=A0A563E9N7_9MICO|nr:isochorismatase family cysteine hydrolase [Leekyejoonella antrihumi]TWP39039.1 cysteine hydrolase [Leekyejoonella antrihumi]